MIDLFRITSCRWLQCLQTRFCSVSLDLMPNIHKFQCGYELFTTLCVSRRYLCKFNTKWRIPLQKWTCCHCNQRQLVIWKKVYCKAQWMLDFLWPYNLLLVLFVTIKTIKLHCCELFCKGLFIQVLHIVKILKGLYQCKTGTSNQFFLP